MLEDIDYFFVGDIIWLYLRNRLLPGPQQGSARRKCPEGYKCCMLYKLRVNLDITISGVIRDVPVEGLRFKPDPRIEVSITGSSTTEVGICVKSKCECPKSLGDKSFYIKKNIDFGEIDYDKLP